MKKWIAIVSACALVFAFAGCGKQGPDVPSAAESTVSASTTELVTADPATQPEEGRVAEKDAFYVYVPEGWCRMEYASDGLRIRLFDIPSAPDIKEGETPEIEIKLTAGNMKAADVDNMVKELMKNTDAAADKDVKIAGATFKAVTYKVKDDKRAYTAYVGLGGGKLATVTLKGVEPKDADAAAILKSLSFK